MPADSQRPDTAPLFDAALCQCRKAYGARERPKQITIITATGLRCEIEVPHWWEIEEAPTGEPRLANGAAIAEVLATIVQVGHRMTRQSLCEAMEEHGRKRAESVIGEVLTTLTRLGVVDNRQDVSPKGYGLPQWDY